MTTKFIYNVTFISSYWHMTTTVESLYDADENPDSVASLAALEISMRTGFNPMPLANVDIDIEYVGTTEDVIVTEKYYNDYIIEKVENKYGKAYDLYVSDGENGWEYYHSYDNANDAHAEGVAYCKRAAEA